jgi:signal transduction histidine kinase
VTTQSFNKFKRVGYLYLWAWEKSSSLAVVLVLLVIAYGGWRADQKVREDLRLALLDVSADVSHLFLNYQASKSFSSREILELTMPELQAAPRSGGSVSSKLFLQVRDAQRSILYDSRTQRIENIQKSYASAPRRTSGFFDKQARHLEQEVAEGWNLRTAISRKDYLWEQGKWLLTLTFPFSIIIIGMLYFPYYYREAVHGHRFEVLIKSVLSIPQNITSEAELIDKLPWYVRQILGFDAVAIYVREGNNIALRKVDSETPERGGALVKAAKEHPITVASPHPEAEAVRKNHSIFVARPAKHKDIHRPKLEAWGDTPYIIAPIYDPRKGQVIGLLTAERKKALRKKDQEALEDLAMLVILLLENVRSSARLEETYRRMIRQTRQVALGTVVPIIAHNLKTPLTMISMIADDLVEKWERTGPEVLHRRLEQIKTQSSQSLALIERINQYRKIGLRHRTTQGERSSLDLCGVLEKVYNFFESYFEIRQIHLAFDYDSGFRPFVAMEELDLLQVLTNLLINADEAFPIKDRANGGCEVKILVERSQEPAGALIRISDNGPGIPPGQHEEIFNEDFTTKADGTGAGLPYCRSVIRSAHGWMKLDTSVEKGASFLIFLPTETR